MIDLTGKVAVVTGSGKGIGEAIARKLAEAGATVVVADIDAALANETTSSIGQDGGKALAVQVDVADEGSVRRMVDTVKDRLGGVDILVNNAGVMSRAGLEDTSLEEWNRVLTVNLTGMFLCIKAVAAVMKETGGYIVNMASMSARTGGQASPVSYATSKTGVIGLTKAAARVLGRYNIRVNAVCPGIIDTEMIAHMDQATRQWWIDQTPLRRLGTIDDVAKVVLFLSSDLADYVTGATVDINGGYAMY